MSAAQIAEVAFPLPVHKNYHYLVPEGRTARAGLRVRAPFGSRVLVGTVVGVFNGVPERRLKSLAAFLDEEPTLTSELFKSALWLASRYGASVGEALRCVFPEIVDQKRRRSPAGPVPAAEPPASPPRAEFVLTASQESALSRLMGSLAGGKAAVSVLYGVPASGKTEVYRRLIREAVRSGGQALFLVPEISLTLPFYKDFADSLGVPIGIWHSGIGARPKRELWHGLKDGRVKVVVGARSACLLPFKDLRLVVIDEEQDESFKEGGRAPYYHARELALERAQNFGALVVLGSATPSLEAWHMARTGRADLVAMPERVSKIPRPPVCLARLPGSASCLSPELVERLGAVLEREEQAIVVVNRRGFTTLLLCRSCGWVDRCPSCGVAKIRHKGDQGFFLSCHHCSGRFEIPRACGGCGKPSLSALGTGTQKVVSEIEGLFPRARVLRLDGDTPSRGAARAQHAESAYEKFLRREADVLVGTKLVAKSFHFPGVTLVGIADADTMLHMPDFRASERTLQLLCQAAGRSGRADRAGEVVIQTRFPEHGALASAVGADYASFADAELDVRRELGYPPFVTLIRAVFTGGNEAALWDLAREHARELEGGALPGISLVGPAPAVLRLESGKTRLHLLIKLSGSAPLDAALSLLRRPKMPSWARRKIDVEPYDLF